MDHLNITTEILDVAEARRRIPLVRPHVQAIMAATREMRALHEAIQAAETPEPGQPDELQDRMAKLEDEFRVSLKAMNALGAYLKDADTGLIDFYTWRDGEMVFLCWREGEPTIEWWHGLDEGFSGRKRLG